METKECKICFSQIDSRAKKCPNCRADLRSWFRRHPIITFILFLFLLANVISIIPITSQYRSVSDNLQETEQTSANEVNVVLPVKELVGKSVSEIKRDYDSLISDYSEAGLTPSKKIKITGFDLKGTKANIQVDYNVVTGKPYYVGVSYDTEPLPQDQAWKITGFTRPKAEPKVNEGILNRKVYVWENIEEISPFKMIQMIVSSDGRVGKISFGMENLETAQSEKSLYFVPD